jgi:hypothetical protein
VQVGITIMVRMMKYLCPGWENNVLGKVYHPESDIQDRDIVPLDTIWCLALDNVFTSLPRKKYKSKRENKNMIWPDI